MLRSCMMGSGASTEPTRKQSADPAASASARLKKTKEIDERIMQDRITEKRTVKLLLLGAAESGKSTFAKQMKIIHMNGFNTKERCDYKPLIYSNIISSMQDILAAMEKLNITFQDKDRESDRKLLEMYADLVDRCTAYWDSEIAAAIKRLWQDQGVRTCLTKSDKFHLNDSAEYYFNKVELIAHENYIPDDQDVLRARLKTSGVIETNFTFKDYQFRMFDVGGQRTERRKWLHYFDNVTAIIFTAALSGYDQLLREDDKTNRMHESLNLFTAICNYQFFTKTSIILFLNKRDIFEKKIKYSPLTQCFPHYKGINAFMESADFIRETFESVNMTDKEIYTHLTVATDTSNINFVFDASMAVVLKLNLEEAGLF